MDLSRAVLPFESYQYTSVATATLCYYMAPIFVVAGIAYALYFSSMKDLNAQTVALFGYIDPVVAIILSAVILGESMNILEIIGAVLILCATLVSELPERKEKQEINKK